MGVRGRGINSVFSPSRWTSTVLLVLMGCSRGDVGAPCNHGHRTESVRPGALTFPALSCNELLCVYQDSVAPPMTACKEDADCNMADPSVRRFKCEKEAGEEGTCKLALDFILDRSMCSKKCDSDEDCRGDRNAAEETSCQGSFRCVRHQALGDFCCEKLCICEDDLGVGSFEDLEQACASGTQEGCCDRSPLPEGCGR